MTVPAKATPPRRIRRSSPRHPLSSAETAGALSAAAGIRVPAWEIPTEESRPAVGHETAPTAVQELGSVRWPVSRSRWVFALTTAAVLAAVVLIGLRTLVPDAAPAGPGAAAAPQPVSCEVRYDVRQDSGHEFTAGVTLTNTGNAPIPTWRLDFTFPSDQQVVWSSAGAWQQSGQSVSVEGTDATGSLPAGESVILGFEGSYRDANPLPTAFHLNGTACPHVLAAAAEQPPAEGRADELSVATGDDRGEDDRGGGHGRDNNPGKGNGKGNGKGQGRG